MNVKEYLLSRKDIELPIIEYHLPDNQPGCIKIQGVKKHSEISRLMDEVTKRQDENKSSLNRINEATIEAAVWFYHCVIEPKFSWEDCLMIADSGGLWTTMVMMECQKACGLSTSALTNLVEDIKKDPLEEDTSKPVSMDSTDTP